MDTVSPGTVDEQWRRHQALWRRLLFFGLTFLTATVSGFLMLDVLKANGFTPVALVSLVMFVALFTWIAGAFWTAVAGFTVRLVGRDPAALHAEQVAQHPLQGRTAIVVPICNEETARVFAGIEATWSSMRRQPQASHFDLFVLSDTSNAETAAAEQDAWGALAQRSGPASRLFYRRRDDHSGRKTGNIAEFVRNWGAAYDYMIVLDADSVMSGRALVSLAQLMDAHPPVGIIQALPLLAGRDTFFARLLQFAVRLNGPMFASGLTFWQLGDSNYWGHNAILRLRPFAEHCALPRLPGSPPFGGEILSHDIVEAAFMRRAGYQVWLVPDIAGSWEEIPSNVLDYAARDRRWAQGNLQHIGVLPMKGLHWLSRIHIVTGILSYVTSPMWLLVLILTTAVNCVAAFTGHQYFQPGAHSLFPSWPQYRDGEIAAVLAMTITVLILPKLLAAFLVIKDRRQRAAFGGAGSVARSVVFEQLLSMLLAPTLMLFHSEFVLRALLGRSVGWDAQARGDRGVSWREALIRHKWHLVLGLIWGGTILALAPETAWWMLPVQLCMLVSVPITVQSRRSDLGRALRRHGWLLTPEETAAPPELAALTAATVAAGAVTDARGSLSQAGSVYAPMHPPASAVPAYAPLPMVARAACYPRIGRLGFRGWSPRRASNPPP